METGTKFRETVSYLSTPGCLGSLLWLLFGFLGYLLEIMGGLLDFQVVGQLLQVTDCFPGLLAAGVGSELYLYI